MGLVFRENATFPIIGNKDDGLYCSWRILLVGTVSVLALVVLLVACCGSL